MQRSKKHCYSITSAAAERLTLKAAEREAAEPLALVLSGILLLSA